MASNANVKAVQSALGIAADGVAGPATKAAVIAYQKKHGLATDGVIGPATLSALGIGSSSTAAPAATGDAKLTDPETQKVMADNFGLSLTVINSIPDLKAKFDEGVANHWDGTRFQAEVRNTDWFKNNSDAARAAKVEKLSNPASYAAGVAKNRASLVTTALSMGAQVTGAQLDALAEQSYTFGWNSAQTSQALGDFIGYNDGHLFGTAAQYETDIRRRAADQGIHVDDATVLNWVKQSEKENGTDGTHALIDGMAASSFPALADQIKNGQTVASLASGYKNSMANILEVNPDTIDNFDPTIRAAMSGQGADGKPAQKSIWQFENDLRQDPRWRKTKNAQDSVMSTAHKVLADFGFMGGS